MSKKQTLKDLDNKQTEQLNGGLDHLKEFNWAKDAVSKPSVGQKSEKTSIDTIILNASKIKTSKQTERIQFLIYPELLSKISIKAGIRKKDINQYLKRFIEMSFKN